MNNIHLSICIPTYNFGKFIGETLESLLPQLTPNVEIVIFDGGSTDNTANIVERYLSNSLQIRYIIQNFRGGIDADMHRSVEHAAGEYCWLFSSDDVMKKTSIEQILTEIELSLDVYLCGFDLYSFDLNNFLGKHSISSIENAVTINFASENERKAYFQKASTSTAFFSFMSSLIVKRRRWLETALDEKFFGTCWAHVARIFNMIPNGLKVKYLPASLLMKRHFNDSFMDKGLVHRLGIAIDGYHQIADCFFGFDSPEAYHIRRVIRNEITIRLILKAKESAKTKIEKRRLCVLIGKLYCDTLPSRIIFTLIARLLHPKLCYFITICYLSMKRSLNWLRKT